jgi:hypothetical protein
VSDNAVSRYDIAEQIVRAQLQRDALDEQIASLKAEFRDGQSEDQGDAQLSHR